MRGRVAIGVAVLAGLALPYLIRPAEEWRSQRHLDLTERVDMPCTVSTASDARDAVLNYFPEVSTDLGVDFAQTVGPLGTYFMPEVNGTGGALFDFDNDGDLDLFLVNSARSPKAVGDFPAGTQLGHRLYRQESDGTFTDVTEGSGLRGDDYGVGCAVGDMDNDGDLDLFVTVWGNDRLYRNNADGTFSDVTVTAGIDEKDYGTCAAFLDYDLDGWLDLIVVNYVHDPAHDLSVACASIQGRNSYCGPHKFVKTNNRLYHNEGPESPEEAAPFAVRYRDVAESTGMGQAPNAGFGVVCADFDADGRPDIFIANDMGPKQLWMNRGAGAFVNEAVLRGAALSHDGLAQGSMGVAVGDVDGDGNPDIAVTNLFREATALYLNNGAGMFEERARGARLDRPTLPHTGWGIALVDLDHDGDLDLAQVNGLVVPCHSGFLPHGEDVLRSVSEEIQDPSAFWRDYADDNVLLLNDGKGRFVDESDRAVEFTKTGNSGRALIWGDIDEDGDLDLVVTNCGGRARIYRNEVPKSGHWLLIRAVDPALQRDAYGAEVTVRARDRLFRRTVHPASSYLASNDVRAHFGLGLAAGYDGIVVHWPDGQFESFRSGPADRALTLRKGEGRPLREGDLP